jgi:hypothetical protein
MNKVYANPRIEISTGDFERPVGDLGVEIDCRKKGVVGGATTRPTWD